MSMNVSMNVRALVAQVGDQDRVEWSGRDGAGDRGWSPGEMGDGAPVRARAGWARREGSGLGMRDGARVEGKGHEGRVQTAGCFQGTG